MLAAKETASAILFCCVARTFDPGMDCRVVRISLSLNEPPKSSPSVSTVGVAVGVVLWVSGFKLSGKSILLSAKDPPKSCCSEKDTSWCSENEELKRFWVEDNNFRLLDRVIPCWMWRRTVLIFEVCSPTRMIEDEVGLKKLSINPQNMVVHEL